MASTSLMFGSLAHFYEKPVVVLATSCVGTLAFLYGEHDHYYYNQDERIEYLVRVVFNTWLCVLGIDYFLRTSFSVTIESFLLRIKDVLWDGMKSELSNWTYRAKVPDHLTVRFTGNCK